ncbi:MAG: hypothetical protein M9958_05430 [Chitinophagales bacterium]|nr:hypothetical protein [Chitinophagales bacterium]
MISKFGCKRLFSTSIFPLLVFLLFSFTLQGRVTGVGSGNDGDIFISQGQTYYTDNIKTKALNLADSIVTVQSVNGFIVNDILLAIDVTNGSFEFGKIKSISGSTLQLYDAFEDISFSSNIQVIRVPQFKNLTINEGGKITCSPFNLSTGLGGVVAFFVQKNFYMNGGIIDVKGKGFPGGIGGMGGNGGTGNPAGRPNGGNGEGMLGLINAGYGGIEGNEGTQGQDGTIISYPGSGNPSSNISTPGYLYLGGGASGGRGGKGGNGSGSSGGTMCIDGLQGTIGGEGGIGGDGGAGGGVITFVINTVVKNPLDETKSTVFDLRGENGGTGHQGTSGNDGPDGVCGGGGGRGAKGGDGGNPGGGGAGGKGYFSILSGMPSLNKILLSGGGVGEKGISSPSGTSGERGIITSECSCGIPIPPGPVSCNVCSMKKVLDLISATNTFVAPNKFSNDTISCVLSKVYDCVTEVDLLQCKCIEIKSSNDTCYINGFIQDGAEDIILHLAQKDSTITYDSNTVSSINDGSFNFLSCELDICEYDNDGDSYEVFAGNDGSVEFDIPVLPITLRELAGYCKNGIPIVEWKTESEFNNDYFSIYKSKDGLQKELIARIDGMGTKMSPTEYLWEDNSKTDEPYYHLQQTDIDGKSYWLGTIYIQCNNRPQEDIKVYFNNLSKGIIISNLSYYPTTWELYNVLGSQLKNGKINQAQGENNIYLNDIIVPNGIYFLQMRNQKMQKSFTLKID